jgi:hypothetical protein
LESPAKRRGSGTSGPRSHDQGLTQKILIFSPGAARIGAAPCHEAS